MRDRAFKRPESVLVVVYSADGRVLLLRRHVPANFWQSVTGSLEWGEDAAQAARRELYEETGLLGEPQPTGAVNRFAILPQWRSRYGAKVRENVERVFHHRLAQACPIRLNPREHAEFRWVAAAEAARMTGSSSNRAAIEALFAP